MSLTPRLLLGGGDGGADNLLRFAVVTRRTRFTLHRFLYRNLADLLARIPDLDRAMRGLLQRERQAALNLLSGLEQAGAMQIEPLEKEMLTDSISLSLTYWVPFADLLDPLGLEDSSAQIAAIARVLLMVTPHLREPEKSQMSGLAAEYLARSGQ